MDRLPPRWVRRLVLAPLILVLCAALLCLVPFLLVIAALSDVFVPGHLRTTRMVAFAGIELLMEIVGLVAMFVLWIRFGLGTRLQTPKAVETHYVFMARWLFLMYLAVGKCFGLRIN